MEPHAGARPAQRGPGRRRPPLGSRGLGGPAREGAGQPRPEAESSGKTKLRGRRADPAGLRRTAAARPQERRGVKVRAHPTSPARDRSQVRGTDLWPRRTRGAEPGPQPTCGAMPASGKRIGQLRKAVFFPRRIFIRASNELPRPGLGAGGSNGKLVRWEL